MNIWRRELKEMLACAGASRPPALRRSDRPEWLYATDLPGLVSPEELKIFLEKIKTAGWESRREGDWLLLNRRARTPPEGWFEGPFGREAACCLSLLERRGGGAETEGRTETALIKAGEEGPAACERIWTGLHREWAGRLRKKEPLPEMDPAWFGRNVE